jgi:hypothetical protein
LTNIYDLPPSHGLATLWAVYGRQHDALDDFISLDDRLANFRVSNNMGLSGKKEAVDGIMGILGCAGVLRK